MPGRQPPHGYGRCPADSTLWCPLVALHPGTVNSPLSQPFRGAEIGRSADDAAKDMLTVFDSLIAAETGRFYAYNGEELPW